MIETAASTVVTAVPYDRLEGFGADHPWRRLSDPAFASCALNIENPVVSASPFLDRKKLAERIVQTHEALGHPIADETADAIRTDARFVVAGQQPGLMMGPAYVLYKAVTAIQLARRLSGPGGRVLPAFWVADEDHRLEPLLRCTVGDQTLSLGAPTAPVPADAFGLAPFADEIAAFVERAFDGAQRQHVMELFDSIGGGSLADQFNRALLKLFAGHGLILIDPMRMADLTEPVLNAAVGKWSRCEEAFAQGSDHLATAGIKPPIEKLTLFSIDETGRRPMHEVTGPAGQLSAGAALRPVVQDAIVPTIATVAGPTETAYLWQIDPLYAALDVSRSAVVPRLGATVVGAEAMAEAETLGLGGAEIFSARRRLREPAPVSADLAQTLAPELKALQDQAQQLIDAVQALRDGSSAKVFDKAADSIRYQIDRVVNRAQTSGGAAKELRKLAEVVYPRKRLQERMPGGAVALWARFGDGLIETLLEQTVVLEPNHWLVVPQGVEA